MVCKTLLTSTENHQALAIMASSNTKTLTVEEIRNRGIEDLPPELLEEIFLRIPVHHLIQTKYVCKPWRNIFNHPIFPINHYARNNQNPTALIYLTPHPHDWFIPNLDTCHKAIMIPKPGVDPMAEHFAIVGSLNGFICFETAVYPYLKFTIFNPSITAHPITLPNFFHHFFKYTIDFEYFNGFGYSPNTKEYKVIRMITDHHIDDIVVGICTLGSNRWRYIALTDEANWKYSEGLRNYSGVFLNGYLHWLIQLCNLPNVDIKAFNVEDETFGLVPIPPHLIGDINSVDDFSLGVLSNCLIIVDSRDRDIKIWMMKEYGVDKSWVLQFVIPDYCTTEMPRGVQPLAFQNNGNLLCNKFGNHICYPGVHSSYPTLFSYDPKTKTTNEIRVTGLPKRIGSDPWEVISHVGTLLTLENVVHMERM